MRRHLILAPIAVALVSCSASPTADDRGQEGLRRGDVTLLAGQCTAPECLDTCGPAGCMQVEVACPGIPDVTARLRVTGSGAAGTLVLFTGGPGRGLFGNVAGAREQRVVRGFLASLHESGVKTVEVGWDGDGPWGLPADRSILVGSRTLACRPGSLLPWIHGNVHEDGFFAAQGNSGGASQIAFSLAHYGASELLDIVNLGGGPPPCPIAIGGQPNYTQNEQCLGGPGVWNESLEPLLAGSPELTYPATVVNFFLGEHDPSRVVWDSAEAYFELIDAEDKSFTVVPNTGHGTHLTEEGASAQRSALP